MSESARNLIISTIFFALMQVSVKMVPHIPTAEVVVFRGAVALSLCLAFFARRRVSPFGRHHGLLVLRGVAGTCALFLFFFTLQRMPMAAAVTLQYLSPIFTVLIASALYGENANRYQWLALMVACAGVFLIHGFDTRVPLWLAGCAVLSALCSATAYNVIRGIGHREDPMTIVFYFPLVTTFTVGPFAVNQWVTPAPVDFVYLILCGVFVQIAQIYMTKAYQAEKAANIVAFKYLGAVFAAVLGYTVFGETIGLIPGIGMVLIVAGAFMANLSAGSRV